MDVKLARAQRGTMIHRADCGQINRQEFGRGDAHRNYTSRATPWNWADDKTEQFIAYAIVHFGYRVCKRCKPVSDSEIQAWRNTFRGVWA